MFLVSSLFYNVAYKTVIQMFQVVIKQIIKVGPAYISNWITMVYKNQHILILLSANKDIIDKNDYLNDNI